MRKIEVSSYILEVLVGATFLLGTASFLSGKTPARPAEVSQEVSVEEKELSELKGLRIRYSLELAAEKLRVENLFESGAKEEVLREAVGNYQRLAQKRNNELITKFRAFLEKYPRNASAYNELGDIFFDTGRRGEALECWKKAVEIRPEFAEAHNNLAVYYSHQGPTELAIKEIELAVKYGPDRAVHHWNYAVFVSSFQSTVKEVLGWDKPKMYREALIHYKKACQLLPKDKQFAESLAKHYLWFEKFGAQLDWDEAEKAWLNYIKIAPSEEATAYFYLVHLALMAKMEKKAKEYLDKLEALDGVTGSSERLRKRLEELEKEKAAAGNPAK